MPGHTGAWMPGYPELASAPGPYEIEMRWGVFDPTMDPTREETYQFLDAFIGEMAALFPDEYFHIGGDENNGKQWRANPQIQAFMKAHGYHTTAELQTYFNQRVLKIVQKYGKKMVGWDEILTPDLPKETVVQSWRGYKSLDQAAREGYNAIWSTDYYLDHMGPAEYHYLSDPLPADSKLTSGAGIPRCGRRSLHVERVRVAGEHRQPHLAAHGGDCRALLVAAERQQRSRHVPPARCSSAYGSSRPACSICRAPTACCGRSPAREDLGPLATLGKIASPEGVGTREEMNRHEAQPSTQLVPLVKPVDAVVPDPPYRRQFAAQVDAVVERRSEVRCRLRRVDEDLSAMARHGSRIRGPGRERSGAR